MSISCATYPVVKIEKKIQKVKEWNQNKKNKQTKTQTHIFNNVHF